MIRKKKGIKALALGLVITVLSCSFAFADTATIPMSLAIKAKEIDVTVTEKVIMSASAGKSVMDVGDITVTNNAAGNGVYLLGAAYGGNVSPWSLVADSTNFKTMKKDQHKYSLTADGTDLSASSKEYSEFIDIGGSYTITMAGKTGISTSAVSDQQAGSVVLTVGVNKPVKIVSWADGTDAEIAAMVDAAERGEIDLTNYWSVGDTRTVHVDAMPASYGQTAKSEMDVQMILQNGVFTISEERFCSFSVLIYAPQLTNMKKHSEETVDIGLLELEKHDFDTPEDIYKWLDNTFINALSPTFKSIFGTGRYLVMLSGVSSTFINNLFAPLSFFDARANGDDGLDFIQSTWISKTWSSDYGGGPFAAGGSAGQGSMIDITNEKTYLPAALTEEAGLFYLKGAIKGGTKAVSFSVDGWEHTNKMFVKSGDTWNDVLTNPYIYQGCDTTSSIKDGRVYTYSVGGNGYLTLNGQPVYATDLIVDGARYVVDVENNTTS